MRKRRDKGVLCNAVDDPPFCDFYFPSVVRRGDLQIAISTAGASPALAQRLRKEINAQLPLDAGDWLDELGNLRREVTQMEPLNDERKWLLHQLAQREVCGYDGMSLASACASTRANEPVAREEVVNRFCTARALCIWRGRARGILACLRFACCGCWRLRM